MRNQKRRLIVISKMFAGIVSLGRASGGTGSYQLAKLHSWLWNIAFAAIVCVVSVAMTGMTRADTVEPIAPYVAPQLLVKLPDGRNFNFVCRGEGAPVVILEVGLGSWSYDWRSMHTRLAKMSRVCISDRAGYGFSDPGPLPRDTIAAVTDLEQALVAARLPPPYLLVGSSLGGLNARLFTYRNPEKVVGLLLLDPTTDLRLFGTPEQYAKFMDISLNEYCLAQSRAGTLVPGQKRPEDSAPCVSLPDPTWTSAHAKAMIKVLTQPSLFDTVLAEAKSGRDVDADEVAAARHSLGNMPLVILSQDRKHFHELSSFFPSRIDQDYDAWIAAHEDEATDSTRGISRIIDGSGHVIAEDKPEAVESALREMMEVVRGARAKAEQ